MADYSQKDTEFVPFLRLVAGASSYLEIGSRYGDSLMRVAQVLQPGAKIVSVELPEVQTGRKGSLPVLEKNIESLKKAGFDAHLIVGDSHDAAIQEAVHALSPFDVVFIDGDHSEDGVRKDWEWYGPMGAVIGFHDAAATVWDAAKVWNEIKQDQCYAELFDLRDDPQKYMGIGVLFKS